MPKTHKEFRSIKHQIWCFGLCQQDHVLKQDGKIVHYRMSCNGIFKSINGSEMEKVTMTELTSAIRKAEYEENFIPTCFCH